MKVTKAIEILDYNLKTYPHLEHEDFGVAIKLGIEALKARKVWNDNEGFDPIAALPGETPEEDT